MLKSGGLTGIGVILIFISIFVVFTGISVSKDIKNYTISTKAKIIKTKCQLVAIKMFKSIGTYQTPKGWVQHYNNNGNFKVKNVFQKNLGKMTLAEAKIKEKARDFILGRSDSDSSYYNDSSEKNEYKTKFERECKYDLSYKINDKKYNSSLVKYATAQYFTNSYDEKKKGETFDIMVNKDSPTKIIEKTSKHNISPKTFFIIAGVIFVIAMILFYLPSKEE